MWLQAGQRPVRATTSRRPGGGRASPAVPLTVAADIFAVGSSNPYGPTPPQSRHNNPDSGPASGPSPETKAGASSSASAHASSSASTPASSSASKSASSASTATSSVAGNEAKARLFRRRRRRDFCATLLVQWRLFVALRADSWRRRVIADDHRRFASLRSALRRFAGRAEHCRAWRSMNQRAVWFAADGLYQRTFDAWCRHMRYRSVAVHRNAVAVATYHRALAAAHLARWRTGAALQAAARARAAAAEARGAAAALGRIWGRWQGFVEGGRRGREQGSAAAWMARGVVRRRYLRRWQRLPSHARAGRRAAGAAEGLLTLLRLRRGVAQWRAWVEGGRDDRRRKREAARRGAARMRRRCWERWAYVFVPARCGQRRYVLCVVLCCVGGGREATAAMIPVMQCALG